MKKTLGGDRLGSGKKQKIELHGYERSTHDLGYIWKSSMSSGTLVPFMSKIALRNDTFDIDLDCDVKTLPTIGPLFGSYKIQLDVFIAPIRLYQARLHNNELKVGMNMSSVKLPQMTLIAKQFTSTPDIDNAQINPSCLLSYLGIRGVGIPLADSERDFNATSLIAYWDIYKNYYANKQEEIGAVIHGSQNDVDENVTNIQVNATDLDGTTEQQLTPTSVFAVVYTGTPPDINDLIIIMADGTEIPLGYIALTYTDNGTQLDINYNFQDYGSLVAKDWKYKQPNDIIQIQPKVETFPLDNIDAMRTAILQHPGSTPFSVNTQGTPYSWLLGSAGEFPNMLLSQEGLAIKTYQSDLFNNWLSTEWIDGAGGISELSSVDTSGGSFTMDQLNLAGKVYKMLNRIAVGGGSYYDWLDVQYGEVKMNQCLTPMYMGGLIKELIFQEVISNSESQNDSGTLPLGTLAGRGVMARKHKGGKITIKVDEPSYIIGIISLTPRIDYSQGNEWDTHLQTMDDLHKPALDEIGFQELITEQMAWWSTSEASAGVWQTKSAGKQPAWINYMTSVNKTYGNFAIASNEMFMTLNRRYEYNSVTKDIEDLTTYIDPVKGNNIFAQTSLDAQNFWVQIAIDITARRKMSAKIMPNL